MRAIDITNQRFGKLIALEVVSTGKKRMWRCLCDCGNEVILPTFQLRANNNTSCGCGRTDIAVGQRFGNLVVTSIVGYNQYGKKGERLTVSCQCDCGGVKETFSHYLTRGTTDHCGCMTNERRSMAMRGEYGTASRNTLIHSYRSNARHKGVAYNISDDTAIELFQSNCHYCGAIPSRVFHPKKHYGGYTYNGIDRLTPALGYTEGNVVPCCTTCNFLKSDYTHEEFIGIINKIAKHTGGLD